MGEDIWGRKEDLERPVVAVCSFIAMELACFVIMSMSHFKPLDAISDPKRWVFLGWRNLSMHPYHDDESYILQT